MHSLPVVGCFRPGLEAWPRRAGLWLSFECYASAFGSWCHSGLASQSGPGSAASNQERRRAARGGLFGRHTVGSAPHPREVRCAAV